MAVCISSLPVMGLSYFPSIDIIIFLRDVAKILRDHSLNDDLVFDNIFQHIQTVAAPGLASMEVLLSREEVLFMAAINLELNYGPDSATVSNKLNIYRFVVDVSMIYTIYFPRCMPYQGLKLIGSLSVENILDFSVYRQGAARGRGPWFTC